MKAVKDFLAKIQRPDRLGTNFFTDDERQQWQDYFDQQPLTAEAASDAATLLPVQMPRKCLPRTAAAGSSGADSSTQQEIISYSNAGGRQLLFQPAEAPDGI